MADSMVLVNVRVSKEERELWKKMAHKEELSLSDLIRSRMKAVDGHGRRVRGSSREGTGLASRVDPGLGNQGGRVREQPIAKETTAGRKKAKTKPSKHTSKVEGCECYGRGRCYACRQEALSREDT